MLQPGTVHSSAAVLSCPAVAGLRPFCCAKQGFLTWDRYVLANMVDSPNQGRFDPLIWLLQNSVRALGSHTVGRVLA